MRHHLRASVCSPLQQRLNNMAITPEQLAELTHKEWTGQLSNGREEVLCNACKDGLVNLRWSAWFDPYLPFGESRGSYVHYGCLSAQRKAEIASGRPHSPVDSHTTS